MKKEELRIVYMGTPEFAVESLKCLVEGGYHVVGVLTMPDKPAGRGQKVRYSPVKQYALEQGLTLLQPANLKDPDFQAELKALQADLQIVVAFRMLPEAVWNMPRFGTFNLHASLLPQYRGAAPINWAVINGDRETGITTFFLEHGMDTGKVIQQVHVPIGEADNVGDVHDRLMLLGGKLVLETVDAILAGNLKPIAQSEMQGAENSLLAPKIFKDTCRINWSQSTAQVYNFVRGLSPYPAARTTLISAKGEEVEVKIYETRKVLDDLKKVEPGTVISDGKNSLAFATTDGLLEIVELQQAGKKRMSAGDFLRGFHLDQQN